jgi:hypothetical protein
MDIPHIVLSVLLGIVATILGGLLFPGVQEAVYGFLIRSFSWLRLRRRADFAGAWRSGWHVQSEKYPSVVVDEAAHIRQIGNRIYAKSQTPTFVCHLFGKIDSGRYITGTWYDEMEGGYHGAFQFIVDPATGNFSGKWIGYSTSGVVKEGNWEWERVSSSTGYQAARPDAQSAGQP